MSDLIEKLRKHGDLAITYTFSDSRAMAREAADEIELLRSDNARVADDYSKLLQKNAKLQAFVDAFDEMDEVQPYDCYYKDLLEKVWEARAALEVSDE